MSISFLKKNVYFLLSKINALLVLKFECTLACSGSHLIEATHVAAKEKHYFSSSNACTFTQNIDKWSNSVTNHNYQVLRKTRSFLNTKNCLKFTRSKIFMVCSYHFLYSNSLNMVFFCVAWSFFSHNFFCVLCFVNCFHLVIKFYEIFCHSF